MNEDVMEVQYRGAVTVGSPGRAHLHARAGGLDDFIWDALGKAGWLGHTAQLHPLIEVVISLPACPAAGRARNTEAEPEPGGPRRPGERGRVDVNGTIRKAYQGPLHSRAAGPGVHLVESERRAEDFDSFEDLLYQGADQAGWLTVDGYGRAAGEIPTVDILIRIPRYTP